MASVIKTVLTYPLNGSTTDFNIPFEYLARKFVVVTLLGVDRRPLTLVTDYRFATRTTISTTKAWGPSDGYSQIEIRRVTSATERLVDFTDGSILRAFDLNVAQIQTMHVAEEARDMTADTIGVNNDGNLDARGRRIVNVGNAVEDRDAVPLGQLKGMNEGAWQARNQAQQFRNEAQGFRNEAEQFKNTAVANANSAADSKNKAAQSAVQAAQSQSSASNSATTATNAANSASRHETNAAASANAAGVSAGAAKSEADRAKTEADKLANINDFAASIKSVTPSAVTFNREVTSDTWLSVRTTGDKQPKLCVWRQGIGEMMMTVDGGGNVGISRASTGSPFLQYWDPSGNSVSQCSINTDTGQRYVRGAVVAGYGTNSSVASESFGEASAGSWVNRTTWNWYGGGAQIGTVRGGGTDGQALFRAMSNNRAISLYLDPNNDVIRGYGTNGTQSFEIHSNGDIWMQWGGLLSTQIRARTPKRWSWITLGAIAVQDGATIKFSVDVRGLRGFMAYMGVQNDTVYQAFTFPPLDGRFQTNRKSNWQVFTLSENGTRLTRNYGWQEENEAYTFYVENPDA